MTIIKYGRVLKDLGRNVGRVVRVKREITSSKIVRSNCYSDLQKSFGQTVIAIYKCSMVINKRVFVLRNSHLYNFQKELSKYDGHDESNMSYHERGFKNTLSNYIEMNNIFN